MNAILGLSSLALGLGAFTIANNYLIQPALVPAPNETRPEQSQTLPNVALDELEFNVAPDGTVTLRGRVLEPALRADAERAIRTIKGVTMVVNEIQILPRVPLKNRTHHALYRSASPGPNGVPQMSSPALVDMSAPSGRLAYVEGLHLEKTQ